ncbi:MAG: histidine kinase [Acinetobacter populi]|jgi:signal transduction histidine kinase|uniref:sensor histidine kinase n=1 Tax=Acinetobacter populi TaxID=1582270 RepID=UPI0023520A3F|nr:ATP-binding protein [Acinetobacter populi]MCH4247404.1 histidine kinase [Acinetobacter populi]
MSYQTYLSQAVYVQLRKSHQYCPFVRYITLIVSCILCLIASRAYSAHPSACTTNIQHVAVAQAIGDGTQRPSQGWQPIKQFPDFIDDHWKLYSGSVWYKIHWDYDCPITQKNPVTLVISYINMAGQVYINDDLLWQDQSLVEPLSRSWNMPRYWNIPASALKQGENIIWIRVVAVATQNSGIGQVVLGDASQVMPRYQNFWREQRVLMFFNLIFSLTLGVIAFLIWLFQPKEYVFGWFALNSLAWVIIIYNVIALEPPFGIDTLQLARISIIAVFAYSVFSCLYAWRLAQRRHPRLEKILFLMLFIISLLAIFLPQDPALLNTFLYLTFISAVSLSMLHFISYPFIAWRSGQLEAYLLAGIFIFYLGLVMHGVLFMFRILNSYPLIAYTAPLTTLLIAIILAMRLAKNVKRIEKFNKTLNDSVIEAKNELSISLNYQHQLALENTRLQERMNLAHDLHDGLGGSLVRSMAIVDQSKHNLTNPQFLSMLKLLRDDLRQIIDSGSSSGAKVPETPMIWGAPVRYRFIQIFDELDIQSSWSFPTVWQSKPTTLECLTLLRVIEEALTNILKHSQATQVNVHLYYRLPTQLVLEIEDNGIGFDVDAILESGISVGIRSMQIRLAKIQANMHIESQTGQTFIQVIKDFKPIQP